MAQDDKEPKHECVYVGTHKESSLEPLDKTPTAPATELARSVALSVLDGERGSMRSLPHFVRRMTERDFDVFEIQYAIAMETALSRNIALTTKAIAIVSGVSSTDFSLTQYLLFQQGMIL